MDYHYSLYIKLRAIIASIYHYSTLYQAFEISRPEMERNAIELAAIALQAAGEFVTGALAGGASARIYVQLSTYVIGARKRDQTHSIRAL